MLPVTLMKYDFTLFERITLPPHIYSAYIVEGVDNIWMPLNYDIAWVQFKAMFYNMAT